MDPFIVLIARLSILKAVVVPLVNMEIHIMFSNRIPYISCQFIPTVFSCSQKVYNLHAIITFY